MINQVPNSAPNAHESEPMAEWCEPRRKGTNCYQTPVSLEPVQEDMNQRLTEIPGSVLIL